MNQGPQIAFGKIVSDGNDVVVELGFEPDYVEVVNMNAAAGEVMKQEWYRGMASGHYIATRRLADNGSTGTHTVSPETSGGLTVSNNRAVQTSDPVKVTGTHIMTIPAAFSDDNDELYFRALRGMQNDLTLS